MRIKLSLLVVCLLVASALFASSVPSMPTPSSSPGMTQNNAAQSFNNGLRYRDRAWKAEKELVTATDPARQKTLGEIIRKSYEADIRQQREAIVANPSMFQAYTELGYALRKTGNYDESLQSYDKALQLMPNYGEAIEYRAEAYLGLNRVNDAKDSYLMLYNGGAKELAKQLGDAMQKWVADRKAAPGDVVGTSIDDFAKWISQRTEIAGTAGTGSSWR
jgi:tetratricopeptide (TPR) repeat protein